MKEITRYESIDGRIFDTQEESESWDKKIHKAAGFLVTQKRYFDKIIVHRYTSYTAFIEELALGERIKIIPRRAP